MDTTYRKNPEFFVYFSTKDLFCNVFTHWMHLCQLLPMSVLQISTHNIYIEARSNKYCIYATGDVGDSTGGHVFLVV